MYHSGVDYVSPIEALFPGVTAAVLAVLARTEQPLTLRQVADRAGVSHPQVGRHVDRLEELGVVRRSVVGRSHQVTLTDGAAGRQLRRLARLDRAVLDHMRATAQALEPNALSVTVFGSFARGTAGIESDIDVAVVAEDPADEDWLSKLATWADDVADFAGNPVAEMVLAAADLASRADDPVWSAIRIEGSTIAGRPIAELFNQAHRETQG